MSAISKKIVVVGDHCGKTCLIKSFLGGKFDENTTPTVFDQYEKDMSINGRSVTLKIFDTPTSEDYERLVALLYLQTHVFLLCFAINSPYSLQRLKTKWLVEIKQHCPDAFLLLVGTKSDLRDGRPQEITVEEAIAFAKNVGADRYAECSAKTKLNVENVFHLAAAEALRKKGKFDSNNSCVVS